MKTIYEVKITVRNCYTGENEIVVDLYETNDIERLVKEREQQIEYAGHMVIDSEYRSKTLFKAMYNPGE